MAANDNPNTRPNRTTTTTASRVERLLREKGPLPRSELPRNSGASYEALSFCPSVKNVPKERVGGGTRSVVHYLQEHDREEVLRVWLDANESAVERISDWALYQRINVNHPVFSDAASEILGPFDVGGNTHDGDTSGTCPLCGGEYDAALAFHLDGDCDANGGE